MSSLLARMKSSSPLPCSSRRVIDRKFIVQTRCDDNESVSGAVQEGEGRKRSGLELLCVHEHLSNFNDGVRHHTLMSSTLAAAIWS